MPGGLLAKVQASQGRRKLVLADAYAAGQIAGYQFEARAGIAGANAN
jgi:hypothetical protein